MLIAPSHCSFADLADKKQDHQDFIKLFQNLGPIFQKDTGMLRFPCEFQ